MTPPEIGWGHARSGDHGGVTEEPLGGGNNALEVVRIGETVRRARDAGSAFAAQVLLFLETAGYPYAPRFLGIDDRGRDILSSAQGRRNQAYQSRVDGDR